MPCDVHLVAKDIRYSYADREVLHGINLAIRPGEHLTLIGPSGAGKSTLGRILAGVYTPEHGTVTIGGMPLAKFTPTELRRKVAMVSQEHHVFVGTVRENVALCRPDATDSDIWTALRTVAADAWVEELPEGLHTRVGMDGVRLPPGPAQQIAMARIVLADPGILVLDEATAALDLGAARHLERSLAAAAAGRTVIAIAHRLHTAHEADRVAVLQDGELTQLGNHESLLAEPGVYARLWTSWAPGDTDGNGPR